MATYKRGKIIGYMVTCGVFGAQYLNKDGTLYGLGHKPTMFATYEEARNALRRTMTARAKQGMTVEGNWIDGHGTYFVTPVTRAEISS